MLDGPPQTSGVLASVRLAIFGSGGPARKGPNNGRVRRRCRPRARHWRHASATRPGTCIAPRWGCGIRRCAFPPRALPWA